MIISCSSSPIVYRIPLGEKPDYPIFRDDEIALLNKCKKGMAKCETSYSIVSKGAIKDSMCRAYAEEMRVDIMNNNEKAH